MLTAIFRRLFAFLAILVSVASIWASPAYAIEPAQMFISDNLQKSMSILNDSQLSAAQRSDQFEAVLLGMSDMKRIALFTLGSYGQTSSQGDQDAFVAAFRKYSIAMYRSYLGKYSGQTLAVTGSSERAPGDFIVTTNMVDPNNRSGRSPLEVDFRVRTDSGKPELTDFSVGGIWLALEERDQFVAFLGQNHGDLSALISHLADVTRQLG